MAQLGTTRNVRELHGSCEVRRILLECVSQSHSGIAVRPTGSIRTSNPCRSATPTGTAKTSRVS